MMISPSSPVAEATLHIRVRAKGNNRRGWRALWNEAMRQREMARDALAYNNEVPDCEEYTIHLIRRSFGKMDDDNLRDCLKAVRDGVADWLGIDDGDPRLNFVYSQEKVERGRHEVVIRIYDTRRCETCGQVIV